MLALSLLIGLAQAAVIKPASVTASSTEPGDENVSYAAKNLMDGKAGTVWVEGAEGSGLGSWVELDLGAEQPVTALRVWNGNWYTWDFWNRHNRVKELEVELSDGTKQSFILQDKMESETIKLDKPAMASSVKLKIKGIYRGTTFNDTCLSEVQVMNDQPGEAIKVASYEASSIYPPDGDGNYEPVNVEDGILDSMWCEGNKEGDGTGEWLQFNFDGTHDVSRLSIRNGNAYSFKLNLKSNRAKAATLLFSDGSTEHIKLKPSMMPQTIQFPSHSTGSVRLTFDEVLKGTEYNDLCVSEAAFLP